jgi:hypothetical protein
MTTAPAPKGQPSQRSAYLVLGMHRSGTSAATQLLALAGANLPDNVMPGDEHNAKGYFEPWRIAIFNDQRLRAAGGAWDDAFAHPYRPVPDEAEWNSRAAALFRAEYGDVGFPLLKDPRVSVLMPMWRSVMRAEGLTARCVIPIRHPLAVAGSLARRDEFPVVKSVLLWTAYMLAAEAGSRDLPRAFLDYDALLADWRPEVARLEAAHGAPLPKLTAKAAKQIDAFLSPELRHNASEGDLAGLGEVGVAAQGVYDWFKAAASGRAPDRAPLAAAEALLVRMRDAIGVYVSPVTRALDIAKSELADERARRLKLETELTQVETAIDTLLAAR